jgi:hypothetical protein
MSLPRTGRHGRVVSALASFWESPGSDLVDSAGYPA